MKIYDPGARKMEVDGGGVLCTIKISTLLSLWGKKIKTDCQIKGGVTIREDVAPPILLKNRFILIILPLMNTSHFENKTVLSFCIASYGQGVFISFELVFVPSLRNSSRARLFLYLSFIFTRYILHVFCSIPDTLNCCCHATLWKLWDF